MYTMWWFCSWSSGWKITLIVASRGSTIGSLISRSKIHYRKPALCRVPEALPSVFYRALGKDGLCRVSNKIHSAKKTLDKMCLCRVPFFGTRQRCILPSAIFWHTAKCVFAECLFSGTRQRCILPSAFVLALGKEAFCRVHFFALGKSVFQSNFWGPKWIQMKNFSSTKLYNFSRSTKFILVICSSDIVVVTLFTNLIYLSPTFMKLIWEIWERCRFYEQRYCRFVKWRND